jgi:hypothetical protein
LLAKHQTEDGNWNIQGAQKTKLPKKINDPIRNEQLIWAVLFKGRRPND